MDNRSDPPFDNFLSNNAKSKRVKVARFDGYCLLKKRLALRILWD